MMTTIHRYGFFPRSTLGQMKIADTDFECLSLEDVVRPKGAPKVFGETAIPAGLYILRLSESPKFKRVLPEIVSVPGFTGIRIHAGLRNKPDQPRAKTTHKHSHGCPLTGEESAIEDGEAVLYNSGEAFDEYFARLEWAAKRDIAMLVNITEEPRR